MESLGINENVFLENFDSEDSDQDDVREAFEEEYSTRLDISKEQAKANYMSAGTVVEEEEDQITIEGNRNLISEEVENILDKIVEEINLPYRPSPFQRIAINTLGELNNLILVSPTGSGKMDVPLLSAFGKS